MDELGVPYKYQCVADHPTDPRDICPNEAITPIEVDGCMYCEDHMEQADPSRFMKKRGEA